MLLYERVLSPAESRVSAARLAARALFLIDDDTHMLGSYFVIFVIGANTSFS